MIFIKLLLIFYCIQRRLFIQWISKMNIYSQYSEFIEFKQDQSNFVFGNQFQLNGNLNMGQFKNCTIKQQVFKKGQSIVNGQTKINLEKLIYIPSGHLKIKTQNSNSKYNIPIQISGLIDNEYTKKQQFNDSSLLLKLSFLTSINHEDIEFANILLKFSNNESLEIDCVEQQRILNIFKCAEICIKYHWTDFLKNFIIKTGKLKEGRCNSLGFNQHRNNFKWSSDFIVDFYQNQSEYLNIRKQIQKNKIQDDWV